MNLNINDPAIPAPGEMQMSPGSLSRLHSTTWPASPVASSHGRQPSLGELHQELENEQEAQVVSIFVLHRLVIQACLAILLCRPFVVLFLIFHITPNANL